MAAEIVVPITRIRDRTPSLPLPCYMTPGSAGMDLAADIPQEILLQPLQRTLIPTGFALAVPEGYEAQIRPRSGLALRHGLTMLNTPGTIDADYRDEVHVLLINLGEQAVEIKRGDRIAQLIIAPITHARWAEVDALDTTQRQGGFGHTGTDSGLEPDSGSRS